VVGVGVTEPETGADVDELGLTVELVDVEEPVLVGVSVLVVEDVVVSDDEVFSFELFGTAVKCWRNGFLLLKRSRRLR
jgi:hypothetical protein